MTGEILRLNLVTWALIETLAYGYGGAAMKIRNTLFMLTRIVFCAVLTVDLLGAQTPAPNNPKNPDPELVGQLSNKLHVTPAQATGGAGAIFGLVKTRLSPGEFSKLAAFVPGMGGFLNAAPAAAAGGAATGSLTPAIPGGAGGLASLAGAFQSIGLSPSMVGKFAPIMQNYLGSKGGSGVASLFSGALK
jgi:hypothetical protein